MNIMDYLRSLMCPADQSHIIVALEEEASDLRLKIIDKDSQIKDLGESMKLLQSRYNICVQNMDSGTKKLQEMIDVLQVERQGILKKLAELEAKLIEAKGNTIDPYSLLPAQTKDLLFSYWNKYSEARIEYTGRYLGSKKAKYSLDIRVFGLEGQNDSWIVKRVQGANGLVSDIMKTQHLGFHQACDVAAMRVTNAFPCNYVFDDTSWGSSEFWQFASETEAYKQGDCDDLMIWRYVGCRIAGIPKEMLRMAAGTTFDGQGHATNYYFASDNTWRHINSTSNYSATQDLNKLAKTGEKEALNLKDVWFSFTEAKTWHELSTAAREGISKKKAMKLMENFSITPLR